MLRRPRLALPRLGRFSLLRACISGPAGTPYEAGLFFFDIFLPAAFPSVPPKVHFLTTGSGTVRTQSAARSAVYCLCTHSVPVHTRAHSASSGAPLGEKAVLVGDGE